MTPAAIAEALSRLKVETDRLKAQVVHTECMSRADRELLLATGWLQEIMRGWYMLVRPDIATGDTAAWYANFWDFLRLYLEHRFGDDYCLNAESSLDLHTENPIAPKQVVVITKQASGLQNLLHDTSILMYSDPQHLPENHTKKLSINVMDLPYAICKASPTYFVNSPRDAELALRSIDTSSSISKVLIKYNLKTAASRLIGAYQFINDFQAASNIKHDLLLAGMIVTPTNPFHRNVPLLGNTKIKSPYAGRICAMWAEARETVVSNFPPSPGSILDIPGYLKHIDDIYQYDAYNSLSIEGYQVNDELIDKVKNERWNPSLYAEDANIRNALAAKGYYLAHTAVKNNISQIINGESAAIVIKNNLQNWYQKLFYPAVQAGIINIEDLMGYRNDRVFIRNSRHSPPPAIAVLDAMEAFFTCLSNEDHAGVRAILGHYFFVFIHPYMDGNGRIGRFIMNSLLAAGGYQWTVVRLQNRSAYINSLETAHTTGNLTDFTKFISNEMQSEQRVS